MSVPLHLVERLVGRACPLQPQAAICYLLSVIALKARWFVRSLAANRKVVVETNFCIPETAISERRAA
jgi:hypothetical protein